MSGFEVSRMLNAAVASTARSTKLDQGLNEDAPRTASRPHHASPAIGARRFLKIYYATTGNRPFRIKIFRNRSRQGRQSYRRT